MKKANIILLISMLFLCCLFIFQCKSKEQNSTVNQLTSNDLNSGTARQQSFQLLTLLGNVGPKFQNYAAQNNIVEMKYLDEQMMINPQTFTVDYVKLELNVNKYYPNVSDTGYCYLNVEPPYLTLIQDFEKGTPEFQKGEALFLDIIRTLKKLRPNVKFGFYTIPLTTYWETQMGFYKINNKLDKILKEVDVFFPSFYMFYDDGVVGFLKNKDYLVTNTEEMIKLGIKYNKKVYPFVMHRYHPSNEKLRWSLLPENEWQNYIATIVNNSYQYKKVDGLVWWGPDSYFYGVGTLDAFNKEFKGTQKEYDKFNDSQLVKKGEMIIKEFKNAK